MTNETYLKVVDAHRHPADERFERDELVLDLRRQIAALEQTIAIDDQFIAMLRAALGLSNEPQP